MPDSGGTTGIPTGGGTPLATTGYIERPANYLPLETWRQLIGYNPYHFWGLANSSVPVTSACNTIVKEYAWQQADALGRNEIRESILAAEDRLFEHLGYRVGRRYVTKLLPYPQPVMGGFGPAGSDGRWRAMNLGEGYIRAVGVATEAVIEAAATVVYSDANNDGVTDTFTLTVDVTGITVSADEVEVFFGAADRPYGEPRQERYQIRPVQAIITGNTLTITGRSWLCVRPEQYEGVQIQPFDPDATDAGTGVFAQTLEVVRRYTDPNGTTTDDAQAVLIWETDPWPAWACGCSGSGLTFAGNRHDPAAQAYAVARVGIRDPRRGEVTPAEAVYTSNSGEWSARPWGTWRQPDRVLVRYVAGAEESEIASQLPGGNWPMVVARFAAGELVRRISACDDANRSLYRWQFDRSQTAGANDEQYAISPADLNNPLGTTAGAIYAWKQVMNLRLQRAFVA